MKDAILAVVVLALVGSNLYLVRKYADQSGELVGARVLATVCGGVPM